MIRKHIAAAFVALLLGATPVSAQVYTLHGHPQKLTYNSPAEWPQFDCQCHWMRPDGVMEHVHVMFVGPTYSDISGLLTGTVVLKTFMLDGQLQTAWPGTLWGPGVTNVIFNGPAIDQQVIGGVLTTVASASGTGTAIPAMPNGDPNGLITQTAQVTIDPVAAGWPLRGWTAVNVRARAYLTGGGHFDTEGNWGYYSMLDPNAPETPVSGSIGQMVGVHCNNNPAVGNSLGTVATEYRSFLPIAPISAPWGVVLATYSYGASNTDELANGLTVVSEDTNFHLGVPGTTLFQQVGSGINGVFFDDQHPFMLDPGVIGAGTHTILTRWEQPTGAGGPHFPAGEEQWALVGVPVTVGSAPPPPPNPCVDDPLAFVGTPTFPDLTLLASGWQYVVNHLLSALTATATSITVTDTRGCQTTIKK